MIYVVKLSYRDAGGAAQTAWFSSGRGWRTRSTDTPASTHIEGRLRNPGSVTRAMFRDAAAFGPVEQGFGAVELDNRDGGLDAWRAYYVAGGEYEVFALAEAGEASGTWVSVLKLRMMWVRLGMQRMTIAVRDRLQELDVPLAKNFFTGAGNLEGESFAAGLRKPWGCGDVYNIEPVMIDDTKKIHIASDAGFDATTVGRYEKCGGTALLREANYTSEAQLLSTAPTAGYSRRWPTGGAIRLANSYSYIVTTDISFGGTTDKLAHNCIRACALRAGISSGDISASDISALDASPTINSGYYVTDDESALSVMTKLANGGGLWFGFDRTGVLRIGKVDTYSGTAAFAFNEHNTLEIARDVSGGLQVPIWSITMRWRKRWRRQEIYGVPSLSTYSDLNREWDEYTTSDSTTKTNNPYARSIVRDTYCLNLDSVAAPSAEASRQLTLFKALRAVYRVRARVSSSLLAVDLGSTVSITHPRFGLTTATNFKVIATEWDFGADAVTFTCWG